MNQSKKIKDIIKDLTNSIETFLSNVDETTNTNNKLSRKLHKKDNTRNTNNT